MNNSTAHSGIDNVGQQVSVRDRIVQTVGAFGIAAAVWGLVAVSGGSSLPTIALANGGRSVAAGAATPEAASDNKMAIWNPVNYEFVLEDGVDIAAGREKVYRWVGPTEADVRALAAKLELSGGITPLDDGYNDGWQIGDPAAQAEGSMYLVVYSSGSFSYYTTSVKPVVGCADSSRGGSGTTPDTGSGSVAPDGATESCVYSPEPTKNLPTTAEAEAVFSDFFGELTDVSTYADQYSVYVSGAMTSNVAGVGDAGKQWVSLSFGENAAITGAFGMLGHLEEVGSYPTISAREAVTRLSQGIFVGATIGGPVARDAATTAVAGNVAGNVAESGSGTGEVVTGDSVLVDPIPVPSDSVVDNPETIVTIESIPAPSFEPTPTVPAAPPTTTPVQTVTVRLVKVAMVYQQLWDAKGVMWIVPAYQYTDSDGGQWMAYAVDGKYLSIPQIDPPVALMEGGVSDK